jgi:hypothetical protein
MSIIDELLCQSTTNATCVEAKKIANYLNEFIENYNTIKISLSIPLFPVLLNIL